MNIINYVSTYVNVMRFIFFAKFFFIYPDRLAICVLFILGSNDASPPTPVSHGCLFMGL